MQVSKGFDGEDYAGVVQSYDGSHFRILYDDGDSEELSEDDVENILVSNESMKKKKKKKVSETVSTAGDGSGDEMDDDAEFDPDESE